MKYNRFIFLITSLLLIMFSGCQELYNGDNLQNLKRIPVIQGAITDDPGPYTVTIFWASTYNSNIPIRVSGAKVYILDNFKNSEQLNEVSSGTYKTKVNGIRGIPGRIYHLRVRMNDASIYESVPTMLYPKTYFDTIYPEIGFIDEVSTNYDGTIYAKHVDGLNIYADVIADNSNSKYFKFNCVTITQSVFSLIPKPTDTSTGPPPTVSCRSIGFSSGISQVKSAIAEGTNQIIKKNALVFLPFHIDLMGTDSTTPRINAGWVVSATLSSISFEAYKYYYSISKQLNAGARMFDPIPSQITGNIKCTSDSSRVALGLFEVSSQTTKNVAYRWAPTQKNIRSVNLNDIAPLYDECDTGYTPSFWINF